MTPESMTAVYEYYFWGFEQVWGCIMALTDEQFTEDVPYSMGSMRHQVVHIMSTTRRWIGRLEYPAELPAHLAFEDLPTRDLTKAQWDALRVETMDYICSLSQARLDEVVHWELPNRNLSGDHTRWQILLHAANHATDHRAQILAMLHTHFHVPTVEQDMLFYLLERGA